jgi:arylsulfatase A-like enzyme
MAGKKSLRAILAKSARPALWLAGAFSIAFYWALAETLLVRRCFNSGYYFSTSFSSALNGRIVFYALASLAIWALLALGIRSWRRLRRRDAPLAAVGGRALLILGAAAAWANLNLVATYAAYSKLGAAISNTLLLLALGGVPAVIIVAALFFLLRKLWGRFVAAKTVLRNLAYVALATAVVVAASSYGYKYYKAWSRPVPSDLPDVVLITLDAWRADMFLEERTPNIFEFAQKNALVFTDARAPSSWTLPSFAATMNGCHTITNAMGVESTVEKRRTWAEVMRDNGYDTFAVLSNPYLDAVRYVHRGFSHYDYVNFNAVLSAVHFYDTAWYFALRGSMFKPEEPGRTSRRLTEKTLALLRRSTARPKFIWVHYLDPHYPYQPETYVLAKEAPGLLDKRDYGTNRGKLSEENVDIIKALYAYEVETTDAYVGRLLAELSPRGNTLTIISSDHGEEFFEHGNFEHRKTVYEEVVRVPLIISPPAREPGRPNAGPVTTPTSLVDVAPSVLSFVGLPVPATMEGRKGLLASNAPQNPTIYITFRHPDNRFFGAIIKEYKKAIIRTEDERVAAEYFDLGADPLEQRPLPLGAQGQKLRRTLTGWLDSRPDFREEEAEGRLSFGEREDLRALGYI